jgi:hypothetical protein
MLACVTSFAASLLFLAPVLVMVVLLAYVKIRNRGFDEQAEPAAPEPAGFARELEPIA